MIPEYQTLRGFWCDKTLMGSEGLDRMLKEAAERRGSCEFLKPRALHCANKPRRGVLAVVCSLDVVCTLDVVCYLT